MNKEVLKVRLKKAMPYLLGQTLFPLVTLQAISVSSVSGGEMFVFLLLFPFLTSCISFLYGTRQGFFWGYPLAAGLSFIPTVLVLAHVTALFYVFWYGGFALIGMTFGFWTKKVFKLLKKANMKEKLG